MMMAHDSSRTPPSRLDEATVTAVRAALRAYLSDPLETSTLQRILRRSSIEARDRNIPAEHLIIALKDIWIALPEVRAMTDPDVRVLLLQHVVTMCIKEYYGA